MQSTTENTNRLRARTCYPQGYLDKPRFSSSSDRTKRHISRSNITSSVVKPTFVHVDDKITSNKKRKVDLVTNSVKVQSKKIQNMTKEMINNETTKETDTKTDSFDTITTANDISVGNEATMINDAKIGLKYIKKKNISFTIIGPVCTLLNDLSDDFVKVILKDIIPIESFTAFLVTKKADEIFLKKEFHRNNISNHVYFVDKSIKYTSPLPPSVINVENSHSYKRGFLVDKIFTKTNKKSINHDIVRLFLCLKHNLHNILWVEESYWEIHKSYLFFNNFKFLPISSEHHSNDHNIINDKTLPPFILYCKTPIPTYNISTLLGTTNSRCYYNSSIFTAYLAQIQSAQCNPIEFIVTKYSRDAFPDYQKISSDYNEYWINTRILFNTTIIPIESQRNSIEIFQMLSSSIKSTTSCNAIVLVPTMVTCDIEVIYPFYYVITHDNNKVKYLREHPIHMKTNCKAASAKIKFDWNSLLLPVTSQVDNEFGFWIPCNSFSFTLIKEQIAEDWSDSLSYNVDDGWFLTLNNVLTRIVVDPPSSHTVVSNHSSKSNRPKLSLRSIPLRATSPWIISKRNLTLENLSVANNLPIIAIDTLAIKNSNDLKNILTLLSSVQDKNHSLIHDKRKKTSSSSSTTTASPASAKKGVAFITSTTQLLTNFRRNKIFGKHHQPLKQHTLPPPLLAVVDVSVSDLNQNLYLYAIKEEAAPIIVHTNEPIIAHVNSHSNNNHIDISSNNNRSSSSSSSSSTNIFMSENHMVHASQRLHKQAVVIDSSNDLPNKDSNALVNEKATAILSNPNIIPVTTKIRMLDNLQNSNDMLLSKNLLINTTTATTTSRPNKKKKSSYSNAIFPETFLSPTSTFIMADHVNNHHTQDHSYELQPVQEQTEQHLVLANSSFTNNNNNNVTNNNNNNNNNNTDSNKDNVYSNINNTNANNIANHNNNISSTTQSYKPYSDTFTSNNNNNNNNAHSWREIHLEIQDLKNHHKKIDFQKYTKNALQLLDIDHVIANNYHALNVFKLLQCHLQSKYNIIPKHLEQILSAQIELSEAIKLLLEPAATSSSSLTN